MFVPTIFFWSFDSLKTAHFCVVCIFTCMCIVCRPISDSPNGTEISSSKFCSIKRNKVFAVRNQ